MTNTITFNETTINRFKSLDWNGRRTLCFLYQVSDKEGLVKSSLLQDSVPERVANALSCHPATAYKILNELQFQGFIDLLRLPSAHANSRKNLNVVRLNHRDYYRLAKVRDILLFHPDAEKWLGGASHYRVKERGSGRVDTHSPSMPPEHSPRSGNHHKPEAKPDSDHSQDVNPSPEPLSHSHNQGYIMIHS